MVEKECRIHFSNHRDTEAQRERHMNNNRNVFSIAFKAISFAWNTNRSLFVLLIVLNLFPRWNSLPAIHKLLQHCR